MKNNNWIPISSGLFPEDMEDVQVTYLGYYNEKPYCDAFLILKMEFGIGVLIMKKLE